MRQRMLLAALASFALIVLLRHGTTNAWSAPGDDIPAERDSSRDPNRLSPGSRNEPTSTSSWVVALIDERRLPAEEAGVLVSINVKEGDPVTKYIKALFRTDKNAKDFRDEKDVTPLVQIDTSLTRRQKDVARREHGKAKAEADNEIPEQVATKAADVAWAGWQKALDANKRAPGSIVEVEVMRLKFEYEAAKLRISQAAMERTIHGLTAEVKKEEFYAAQDSIERRRIDSPIDGIVTNIYIQEGEWVKPGDPVLRIINLKKLRVKGFLNIRDRDPRVVKKGQAVNVEATTAGGRPEKLDGKISYVQLEIQSGGDYAVWVDVENREAADGSYILQPGMEANVTLGPAATVGLK